MGMGFGGDIYPRTCLHASSIGICQDSILASQLRRDLDTYFALSISTNHPMVLTAERDDFFGTDRHGGTISSLDVRNVGFRSCKGQLMIDAETVHVKYRFLDSPGTC